MNMSTPIWFAVVEWRIKNSSEMIRHPRIPMPRGKAALYELLDMARTAPWDYHAVHNLDERSVK